MPKMNEQYLSLVVQLVDFRPRGATVSSQRFWYILVHPVQILVQLIYKFLTTRDQWAECGRCYDRCRTRKMKDRGHCFLCPSCETMVSGSRQEQRSFAREVLECVAVSSQASNGQCDRPMHCMHFQSDVYGIWTASDQDDEVELKSYAPGKIYDAIRPGARLPINASSATATGEAVTGSVFFKEWKNAQVSRDCNENSNLNELDSGSMQMWAGTKKFDRAVEIKSIAWTVPFSMPLYLDTNVQIAPVYLHASGPKTDYSEAAVSQEPRKVRF